MLFIYHVIRRKCERVMLPKKFEPVYTHSIYPKAHKPCAGMKVNMKKVSKLLHNNEGLTLVEVLVSMLILSIIVTSATAALIYAARITQDNKIKMTAVNIANERIEDIRSMKFAEVGTKIIVGGTVTYGDPAGDILQTSTKTVNGIEYIINTTISWETHGGWNAGESDWDYKSVRVQVIPKGMEGDANLTKVIETYVTRDSTQPALTGANIRLRLIRGWNSAPGTVIPVSNVKIRLDTGPSAPRQVQTSSAGVARFVALTPGNYKVIVDPTGLGMILNPDQMSANLFSVSDTAPGVKELQVEYPCSLQIFMKDLDGNPLSLTTGTNGTIKIITPYGSDIDKGFTDADINSQGKLPDNFMTGLWPVGEWYVGTYTISDIDIPECQFFGGYEVIGGTEAAWSGTFVEPGTTKNIICYFGTIPATPSGVQTFWVDGGSNINAGSYTALDKDSKMTNGKFDAAYPNQTIRMPSNTTADYYAPSIFFDNVGSTTVPGLYIGSNSSLLLHTGLVVVRGMIEFQNSPNPIDIGNITFSTIYEDGSPASFIDGSLIGGTPGKNYGKLYLAEPIKIGTTTVIEPGGYYYYDGMVLPNNSTDLIPITKDNYVFQ